MCHFVIVIKSPFIKYLSYSIFTSNLIAVSLNVVHRLSHSYTSNILWVFLSHNYWKISRCNNSSVIILSTDSFLDSRIPNNNLIPPYNLCRKKSQWYFSASQISNLNSTALQLLWVRLHFRCIRFPKQSYCLTALLIPC